MFLSSSPSGTPTTLRRRSRVLTVLATTAAASLLGAAIIAPSTLSGSAAMAVAPVPSEEIFQQFVASAIPDTSIPTEKLEIERVPDPEPAPKAEPVATTAAAASRPMYAGGGAPAEWMSAAGIGEGDWGFVDFIARAESGWNPNATNSSSGACGLVQALPCSKVPGNGYDPVDNLRWATGYAAARYGSWQGAYDIWQARLAQGAGWW